MKYAMMIMLKIRVARKTIIMNQPRGKTAALTMGSELAITASKTRYRATSFTMCYHDITDSYHCFSTMMNASIPRQTIQRIYAPIMVRLIIKRTMRE